MVCFMLCIDHLFIYAANNAYVVSEVPCVKGQQPETIGIKNREELFMCVDEFNIASKNVKSIITLLFSTHLMA